MVIWSLVVMECWICHRDSLWVTNNSHIGEFFRLLSHNPPCQWPNDPRITCKSISPAPNGSITEIVIWSLVVMECWICVQDLGQKQVWVFHLVSFVRVRTCPQSLLRGQAPCLHRKCQEMSGHVVKRRPQILSSRPSLKDIPWTLGVFVDISWTFEDIFELCSMSGQIGMSTKISVICPVRGHVADMSRTNKTKVFQTSNSHHASLPMAKWPKNNLQIHFTSSQWIKRLWWTVQLRWSFGPWWSWSVGFVFNLLCYIGKEEVIAMEVLFNL
jgi:hypothetical protein